MHFLYLDKPLEDFFSGTRGIEILWVFMYNVSVECKRVKIERWDIPYYPLSAPSYVSYAQCGRCFAYDEDAGQCLARSAGTAHSELAAATDPRRQEALVRRRVLGGSIPVKERSRNAPGNTHEVDCPLYLLRASLTLSS